MKKNFSVKAINIPTINYRSRLEAIAPNGEVTIAYHDSQHFLLRIALAVKATSINITTLH